MVENKVSLEAIAQVASRIRPRVVAPIAAAKPPSPSPPEPNEDEGDSEDDYHLLPWRLARILSQDCPYVSHESLWRAFPRAFTDVMYDENIPVICSFPSNINLVLEDMQRQQQLSQKFQKPDKSSQTKGSKEKMLRSLAEPSLDGHESDGSIVIEMSAIARVIANDGSGSDNGDGDDELGEVDGSVSNSGLPDEQRGSFTVNFVPRSPTQLIGRGTLSDWVDREESLCVLEKKKLAQASVLDMHAMHSLWPSTEPPKASISPEPQAVAVLDLSVFEPAPAKKEEKINVEEHRRPKSNPLTEEQFKSIVEMETRQQLRWKRFWPLMSRELTAPSRYMQDAVKQYLKAYHDIAVRWVERQCLCHVAQSGIPSSIFLKFPVRLEIPVCSHQSLIRSQPHNPRIWPKPERVTILHLQVIPAAMPPAIPYHQGV